MARQQRIYKVDVKQVAQDIALAKVTGETEIEATLLGFCEFYAIPVSAEDIKENELVYKRVSEALEAKNRQGDKPSKK